MEVRYSTKTLESYTALPYTLGPARQALDAAGLLLTQTFDPYGNPYSYAGPTESATSFGYSGEQTDSNGLVFLRARYYAPSMGRFMQMDPSRQEVNSYLYGLGNPVNRVDPSGLMSQPFDEVAGGNTQLTSRRARASGLPNSLASILGNCGGNELVLQALVRCSDCERFADEVRRFISVARSERLQNNDIVWLLTVYYTGSKLTTNIGGLEVMCAYPTLCRDLEWARTVGDRWRLRDPLAYEVTNDPPTEGSEAAALEYGFRRAFYDNTHHYFFNLYVAYFYSPWISQQYNDSREREQYQTGESNYYDSAADIIVGDVANNHALRIIGFHGVERLPDLILEDVCGDSIEEIYEGWGPPNPRVEDVLGPWQ